MARCLKIRIILLLCLVVPCAAFGQGSHSARLVEILQKRSPIDARVLKNGNAHQSPDANPNGRSLRFAKKDAYTLNGQAVDPI